jgi:hypothetical protein
MVPPGSKAIPPDQWSQLDAFWQMRRAEILADLKAGLVYRPLEPPAGETVAQTQASFIGDTQARSSFIHAANQAGYSSSESLTDLLQNHPIDTALVALTARQQSVIHDHYDELLKHPSPQTGQAAARIAAAKGALATSDEGIRTFLSSALRTS